MQLAIDQAKLAQDAGEVPVGCVVVYNPINKETRKPLLENPQIIVSAYNTREADLNPSSHAEFKAIMQACEKLQNWRLTGCNIYVTLEPCIMCAGLMLQSRVDACFFGAYDKKGGACGSLYNLHQDNRLNHEFYVEGGICQDKCTQLLTNFFKELRK
ncbi:MAG: nucleoside deaminase [Coriobacteriales bacterium]|nr:nucleoside deaminase [Coriobacteriales bacterium]